MREGVSRGRSVRARAYSFTVFINLETKHIAARGGYCGALGTQVVPIFDAISERDAAMRRAQGAQAMPPPTHEWVGPRHVSRVDFSLPIRDYQLTLELTGFEALLPAGAPCDLRTLERVDGVVFVAHGATPPTVLLQALTQLHGGLAQMGYALSALLHAVHLQEGASRDTLVGLLAQVGMDATALPMFPTDASSGHGVFDVLKATTKALMIDLSRSQRAPNAR